jgi:hypothetical protein
LEIEVDDEVFEFLQSHAKPFVDNPNSVLRRLLLSDGAEAEGSGEHHSVLVNKNPNSRDATNTDRFVAAILEETEGRYSKFGRYRYMFESDSELLYFQNFNKAGDRLWYRISEKPWNDLLSSEKRATIYFTCPAMGVYYAIPVAEIDDRAREIGWNRSSLEVNLDHGNKRWIDLDWDIREFLVTSTS